MIWFAIHLVTGVVGGQTQAVDVLGGPVDVEAGSDVGGGGTVTGLLVVGECDNGSYTVWFPRRSLHRARNPWRTLVMLKVLSRPLRD